MYYRPEIQGDTDEYGLVFAVGVLLGVEGARTEVNHLGTNMRCTVKYRPPVVLLVLSERIRIKWWAW